MTKDTKPKTKNKNLNIKNICKKVCSHKITKKIGLGFGSIILLLVVIYAIFNLSYAQVIFPHTYIGDLNLGNKTLAQAKMILTQNIVLAESKELELVYKDQIFKIKPADIDLKYDLDKTLDLVWSTGRKGNLANASRQQLWAIFGSNREKAVFTYSEEKLQAKVKEILEKIDIPEKDATIEIVELEPKVISEKIGQRVDKDKTLALILMGFGNLLGKPQINLTVEITQPKITAQIATDRLEQTKKVINNKITVTGRDKTFTLEAKDIAKLIDFIKGEDLVQRKPLLVLEVNHEKVKKYLETLAKDVNQEAKDAKFNVVNGKVSAFQVAQAGYEIEIDKAVSELAAAILDQKTKYELPVKVTEPEIKSVEDSGIKEVVGQATTNYYGSTTNRRINIRAGAKALHGIIIKPGEEFSTIKSVSPVDASNGYVPELVIRDNKTIPEFGGGLCQVSSTLFRSVLNTGLKITERTNHSYRVPYYEPPIGMDATIYEPSPDFKFVNNMDTPVLIQASVDNEASAITFTLYGTKDGRVVEMSKPVAYAITPAPDPIYTESDTLAPGEIKKVDTAHAGAKADFTYKVTLNGKALQDTNFHSDYTPWPAKYLYGPGTQIPPVE
jgi:vancomycin resistance protein YoaR